MTAFGKQVGGDHYKRFKIQPSKYIAENEIGWFEGNAIKYITRHPFKAGRQDLEKALHYIQMAIESHYGTKPDPGGVTCDQCGTPVSSDLVECKSGHFFCSESCFRVFHGDKEFSDEDSPE